VRSVPRAGRDTSADTSRMDFHISQAGNTVVPAILALESLGLSVEVKSGLVTASDGLRQFTAEDPVAVLGLVKLVETRSERWHASDGEIDDVIDRYGLEE